MDILTIVPDAGAPSCRFRVRQYVEPLRAEGIRLEVAVLAGDERRRWRQFSAGRDFEAVLLHRKLLNWAEFRRLRKCARKLVYDFDDALMFRDSNSPRPNSFLRARKFRRIVSGADLVIAGNDYLAGFARDQGSRVAVLPTPVDLSPYPRQPGALPDKTVGWMGTRSNLIYLKLVQAPLRNLCRRDRGLHFKVVGDGFPEMSGVSLVRKAWAAEDEVADLLGFSVGIMPLLDDPWTRGKCALKILQYFAAYLPVVCSPVGSNLGVISDGVNGYFARSDAEWESRLEELLASPERRREMGLAGRKLVEEKYSLSVLVPRFSAILKETVAR